MSLQDFLAKAVVAAGAGSSDGLELSIAALDTYLENFKKRDRRSALQAARVALTNLQLSGLVADALGEHIDGRIADLGSTASIKTSSDGPDVG